MNFLMEGQQRKGVMEEKDDGGRLEEKDDGEKGCHNCC